MLLRAEAVYPDQVVPGINGGKFRLRPLTMVASFALILVLSGMLAIYISSGSVEASRFRVEQQVVKLTNGFLGQNNAYQKRV